MTEVAVTPNENLDKLLQALSKRMPESAEGLQSELKRCVDAGAESLMRKMDLVHRKEYDIQVALVERLRKQLQEMQARLDRLESGKSDKPDKPDK